MSRLNRMPTDWERVKLRKLVAIDKESLGAKTPPDYEFLYASLSDVNSACVIDAPDRLLCGYHLAILRPKKNLFGPYLNFALHTPGIRYEFSRQANGATRFGLTMSAYSMVELPLPPIDEQKAIAEILSFAQHEIELLKQLADKYKTQKRGLMQKMLTGEWRVKPEIVNQYIEA